MTETTDTTNRDIEAMRRREGAILDLQGVQALLGIVAWAEDSMPYHLAGETRRVAFMLLEQSMADALRDLGMNNEEAERDKAGADWTPEPEPVKPEPVTPGPFMREDNPTLDVWAGLAVTLRRLDFTEKALWDRIYRMKGLRDTLG